MFKELVGSFKDSNNYKENMNLPSVLYRVQKFGCEVAGNKFLYSGTLCLWLLSMALVSCHSSGPHMAVITVGYRTLVLPLY